MPRPVLVKLGGSLLTDKASQSTFRRAQARRLVGELAKVDAPLVLLHGAGSFGHPQAKRHRIGQARAKPDGVAEVLAAVTHLHAEMLSLAAPAGLRPFSISLAATRSDGDDLSGLPVAETQQALDDGFTPVLHGTLVRDTRLGWRVASADELLARLASELNPRLGVFATNVDGVYDRDPDQPGAILLPKVTPKTQFAGNDGSGEDVTGRMRGKLQHAFAVAQHCPTLIVNGLVRNRLFDALRGKPVPGTRVEA